MKKGMFLPRAWILKNVFIVNFHQDITIIIELGTI